MNVIKNIVSYFIPTNKIDICIELNEKINIISINGSIEKRVELLIEKIIKPWYICNVSISCLSHKNIHHPLFIFTQTYSVSIHNYYKYLINSTNLSDFLKDNLEVIFITTIIYLDKLKKVLEKKNKMPIFKDYNILYLFITALCLAVKYTIDDVDYISCDFVIKKVFEIKLENKYLLFENLLLKNLEYNLYISLEEYYKYYKLLYEI